MMEVEFFLFKRRCLLLQRRLKLELVSLNTLFFEMVAEGGGGGCRGACGEFKTKFFLKKIYSLIDGIMNY